MQPFVHGNSSCNVPFTPGGVARDEERLYAFITAIGYSLSGFWSAFLFNVTSTRAQEHDQDMILSPPPPFRKLKTRGLSLHVTLFPQVAP